MATKQTPTYASVINPLALAEIILGQPISHKEPERIKAALEKAFQMPPDELTDPKYHSLPYLFVDLDEKGHAIPRRLPRDLSKWSVKEIDDYCLKLNLKGYESLSVDTREKLIWILIKGISEEIDIANVSTWRDPGDFFEEGTEYADPVQGSLGDCYLIAALSAIAWARPYAILQRNRATGPNNESFVNRIDIREIGPNTITQIEINERVPCNPFSQLMIYARSSEEKEIWPAMYEKAYGRWRNRANGNSTNYPGLNGGDGLWACCELMPELSLHRQLNANASTGDIWKLLQANCISNRTVNPMVAHTYGSEKDAPASSPITYAGSGLVANHVYTILGISQDLLRNQRYVVLRNPWGWNPDVPNEQTGTWQALDQSFWRSVPLKANGIFAMPLADFRRYYWSTDVAK